MKVVLVNTSESKGGAAVACKRQYEALRQLGIDCKLIVMHKSTNDPNVIQIPLSKFKQRLLNLLFLLEIFIQKIIKLKNKDYSLSLFGINLSDIQEIKDADVVHLHWIHNSFVQIRDIKKLISNGKKIFWTMHDMWAFTGGCHYAEGCLKYKTTCYNCPQLINNSIIDIAQKQYLKKSHLHFENIQFLTPSKWLATTAKQSSLLKNANVNSLSNCIDTTTKTPTSKQDALSILGLNNKNDRKIFLFIAMNANDPRKGFQALEDSLNKWTSTYKEKAYLLVIGRATKEFNINSEYIEIIYLGRIFDEIKINAAYSCADVFLMPSKQDNLPNTIMESLTFGTPIVAFPTGGIPEMIIHKKTGYIAESENINSFSEGIHWGFLNANSCRDLCRAFAIENYDSHTIATKLMHIYE